MVRQQSESCSCRSPTLVRIAICVGLRHVFFSHFVFRQNIPTVLKQPSTPFVIAYSVIAISGAAVHCNTWAISLK